MRNFEGYLKQKFGDSYLLLAGGGHKALTDIFTDLSRPANTNNISLTVGGVTKTITLGDRAWDSTSYLPLSGGTITGALTIKGITDTEQYSQGGFNKAYANIILQGDNTYGISGIVFKSMKANDTNINTPSDVAFILYHPMGITAAAYNTTPTEASSGERSRLVIGIGNDADEGSSSVGEQLWLQTAGGSDLKHLVTGTGLYDIITTRNIDSQSVNYANSAGTLNGMSRNSSNNWSGTGLSLLMGMSDSNGGDCLFLTNNSGLMSFCIDGCLYLRVDSTGASRRCLDTYDLSNTTWGTATYSTYTTYLNASYTIGASPWDWNPFNATLYFVWGLQFRISSVTSDTGDMRLYLSPNPPGCGGMGICLNMDGYISTLSLMYAGNGFYTGSDRRFKNNIEEIRINKMLPIKQFNLKSDNTHSYGFVALELEEAGYSELVVNGSEYKSVNYNAALSLCVAILSNKVTELENEIKLLKKGKEDDK